MGDGPRLSGGFDHRHDHTHRAHVQHVVDRARLVTFHAHDGSGVHRQKTGDGVVQRVLRELPVLPLQPHVIEAGVSGHLGEVGRIQADADAAGHAAGV